MGANEKHGAAYHGGEDDPSRKLVWVPTLADYTAPTPDELNAGLDISRYVTNAHNSCGEDDPNLDNVRTEWAHSVSYSPDGWERATDQFDRLLDKVKADAYDEGAEATHISGDLFDVEAAKAANPYRGE